MTRRSPLPPGSGQGSAQGSEAATLPDLDGYTVGQCLSMTRKSEVYAAVREADGSQVVAKLDAGASGNGTSRVGREWKLLGKIDCAGISQALQLLESGDRTVLILKRFPGIPLSSYLKRRGLPVGEFLLIASQLAKTLERVHDARVLHKDLKPDNVLICPESGEVCLVDFGLAADFGEAVRPSRPLEGTLLYMAPEQTGRLGRGVDTRSDLYSLGVTFFELLAGRPPFESEQDLELIHAHMTRSPMPLGELRPELPQVLSRLVLKLLEKDPEDRYPNARALAVDLFACRQQFEEQGWIADDLPLAAAVAPSSPRFTKKLYGRQNQVRALRSSYSRVKSGSGELVLIKGPPGAGKSALVLDLAEWVSSDGYLAQGRFDLYRRDLPYAGFVTAFESLLQQILTESETQIASWKSQLSEGLGKIGQVMVDLVPDLGIILDDLPAVPQLEPSQTRQRLALAVDRFVRVCATGEHPLVLLLDDLHWADAGSRYLMEYLLSSDDDRALLIIATYRDDDLHATHPLNEHLMRLHKRRVVMESITLGPLSVSASAEMLADALGRDPHQTRWLANQVALKTGNLPLLIRQFVVHMHERGLIGYETGRGWAWDEAQISAADIPDDAVGFLTAKIDGLDEHLRRTLMFASCMGDEFDVELLAEVAGEARSALEFALYTLSEEGLIAPCRGGLRFAHHRIRETARSLWREDERRQLHYETGRLLFERSTEEELAQRLFEIVDHLNRGTGAMPEEERLELAELNLKAGIRALRTGAAATAEGYLGTGRRWFRDADWALQPALGYDLYLHSAETALIREELEEALALLASLDSRPLSNLEALQVTAKRLAVFSVSRHPEETVRQAISALGELGVNWRLHPSRLKVWVELIRTRWALRGRRRERGFPRAAPAEAEWSAQLRITQAVEAVMARFDTHLCLLSACLALRKYSRWGTDGAAGYALASYAAYCCVFLRNYKRARRLAEMALRWSDQEQDPSYQPRTEFVVYGHIYPWIMPRRRALDPLLQTQRAARELGDNLYADYCAFGNIVLGALCGEPLEMAVDNLRKLDEMVGRGKWPLYTPGMCHRAYRLLVEEGEASVSLKSRLSEDEALLARLPPEIAVLVRTYWMLVYSIYGDHQEAFQQSERLGGAIFQYSRTSSHIADFCFFRGLSAAALGRRCGGANRRRYRRALVQCYRRLRNWARWGPDFEHMARLMEAERARLARKLQRAIYLYDRAALKAAVQGYPHHAALACEHCATLNLELGQPEEAARQVRQALAHYESWGARPKVARLRSQHAALLRDHAVSVKAGDSAGPGRPAIHLAVAGSQSALDPTTALAVTTAPEVIVGQLMRTATKKAGAQRGLFLLEQEGGLRIEAECAFGTTRLHGSLALDEQRGLLAASVVQYVEQTHSTVVLADAAHLGSFTQDPYIVARGSKSILCVPVLRRGDLIGVLYMENDLVRDAFTQERIEDLELLSSAWTFLRIRLSRQG